MPSRQELEAAHCWENDDNVPKQPETTAFRRKLRYHQARWRAANGHPIGSQPIAPRPNDTKVRPVGNRLPLAYAKETAATFITPNALAAARARTSFVEPHQSFDHQRLWADLLWTPALTFNLFGDLAADLALADRAVHTWWPETPGTVSEVRFAHSPGRFDMTFLGNLVAFDAAFTLDLGGGTEGLVGVMTAYHDWNKPQAPKPKRLPRYREVSVRSGAFGPQAMEAVNGTGLVHIWLAHALALSMLQHPSRKWSWGRFVVVHPADNADFAKSCALYRELLTDDSTFASVTLEELLDSGAIPAPTVTRFRDRYLAY
jgi:PD-(D/E)XK nuclease superfamily protein